MNEPPMERCTQCDALILLHPEGNALCRHCGGQAHTTRN